MLKVKAVFFSTEYGYSNAEHYIVSSIESYIEVGDEPFFSSPYSLMTALYYFEKSSTNESKHNYMRAVNSLLYIEAFITRCSWRSKVTKHLSLN